MPSSRSSKPFPDTIPLPRKVAVVDDDVGCRAGMGVMLTALGCECEAYDSVRAFLHAHAMRRVDCIILDIVMPEINGLTLQNCLRETNFAGPVIFCSGYSEAEIREQAEVSGAVCFLQKPVTKATLVKALQSAAQMPTPKSKQVAAPERGETRTV